MTYPTIKRDSVDFVNDTEVCNLGFYDGKLHDKRPIRCEAWVSYEVEMLTCFISTKDLERNEETLKKLLVDNKIVEIINDDILITSVVDSLGNEFYSINIPLKDHGKECNKCLIDLRGF